MVNYASSEEEYNSMCEAEAAHDAEMAEQYAQDEYEHDVHITRQMNSTSVRMHELTDITKERAQMVADVDNRIVILQDSIKRDCLESGETIKTQFGTVKFRKGSKRTPWNIKQLEGLALVYPEINKCKKTTDTAANAAIKLDV